LTPDQAAEKAYQKIRPTLQRLEAFGAALSKIRSRVNPSESEEFHKNLINDFPRGIGFEPGHYINTKGRNDFVIHHGETACSSVGVIRKAKSPGDSSEMARPDQLDGKVLQELRLYYLQQRVTHKNLELRDLIVTNGNDFPEIYNASRMRRGELHDHPFNAHPCT